MTRAFPVCYGTERVSKPEWERGREGGTELTEESQRGPTPLPSLGAGSFALPLLPSIRTSSRSTPSRCQVLFDPGADDSAGVGRLPGNTLSERARALPSLSSAPTPASPSRATVGSEKAPSRSRVRGAGHTRELGPP